MNTPASAVVPSREAVERFDLAEYAELNGDFGIRMEKDANGEWVSFSAYSKLLAEVESLNAIIFADGVTIEELCEQVGKLRAEVERLTGENETLKSHRDDWRNVARENRTRIDSLLTTVAQLERTVADQAAALAERDKELERYRLGIKLRNSPEGGKERWDAALAASVSSASEEGGT